MGVANATKSLFDNIRKHITKNADDKLKAWTEDSDLRFDPEILEETYKMIDDKFKNPSYKMAIREGSLHDALKSGEFKNQFQVNKSGGLLDKNYRAEHSNRHFGTEMTPKALKASEKYGFLGDPNAWTKQYGDYNIDFRPSHVKDRVTAYFGDSLGSRDRKSFIPGDRATYANTLYSPEAYYTVPNSAFKQMNSDVQSLIKSTRPYTEIQYHGPLDISDIQTITIPEGFLPTWQIKDAANEFGFRVQRPDGRCLINCDELMP